MDPAECLLDFTPSSEPTLLEIVRASCADFRATSAPFEALWSAVGMYAGDFDLTICRASVSDGTFEDRCAAFCAKRHLAHHGAAPTTWTREQLELVGWLEPEPHLAYLHDDPYEDEFVDEPYVCKGSSIGSTLWALGHFGTLCWDWKRMNARAGVPTSTADRQLAGMMTARNGETFLGRLFAQLAWDHTAEDVAAIGRQAQAQLARLPDPAQGVSRDQFSSMVRDDLARLTALCGNGGVIANGFLEDPRAVITRAVVPSSSGNQVLGCMETEREWFGIDFATS